MSICSLKNLSVFVLLIVLQLSRSSADLQNEKTLIRNRRYSSQFYSQYNNYNGYPPNDARQSQGGQSQMLYANGPSQYGPPPSMQAIPPQAPQQARGYNGMPNGPVNKPSSYRSDKDYECGIMPPQITKYVANGKSTENRLWPWHVQIVITGNHESDSETYCGGTLISKKYILTAAHCYDDVLHNKRAKNTVLVFKGLDLSSFPRINGHKKPDTLKLRAKSVYIFPGYVPAMTEYEAKIKGVTPGPHSDLALIEIKLDNPEILNKLMPACLPREDYQVKVSTKCKIMGNGFMNAADEDNFYMPHILQMADVRLSSNQACREDVESQSIKAKINSDVICIRGPIHPCVGDSGGPLLCAGSSSNNIRGHRTDPYDFDGQYDTDDFDSASNGPEKWYLMGVTSFAVSTDENDKCGHFKSAVFGKVSHYIRWINSIVHSNKNF